MVCHGESSIGVVACADPPSTHTHTYIYIYIYTCLEHEGEVDRDDLREGLDHPQNVLRGHGGGDVDLDLVFVFWLIGVWGGVSVCVCGYLWRYACIQNPM